jgi:hypothetical protein
MMTQKSTENRSKTKEIHKRKSIDPALPASTPVVDDMAQPGHSHSKTKRKRTVRTVQTIVLVAALAALPLAYWQGMLQSANSKFERNQRVVELSLDLATFWEAQLDHDTRFRRRRFVALLADLKTKEEKRGLVKALINIGNMLSLDELPENLALRRLIEPDINPDNPEKMPAVMAVSRYRAALVRTLNTMEAIAIVRKHSEDRPEVLNVLDDAYAGTVLQTYTGLKLFIDEYREENKGGRLKSAWAPLTVMADEEQRKLDEFMATQQH